MTLVDPQFEAELIAALRRRLLASAEAQSSPIVNNVYGGGSSVPPAQAPDSSSIHDRMMAGGATGPGDPDDFEYKVDIQRRNILDPTSGKVIGWDKNVHRYRTPREIVADALQKKNLDQES